MKAPRKPPLLGMDFAASANFLRFSTMGARAVITLDAFVASSIEIILSASISPLSCFPNKSPGFPLNPKRRLSPSKNTPLVRTNIALARLSTPSNEDESIEFICSAKPAIPSPYPIKSSDENPPAIAPINRPIPLPTSTNLSIPASRKSLLPENSVSIAAANPANAATIIATPSIAVTTPIVANFAPAPKTAKIGPNNANPETSTPITARPAVNLPMSFQFIEFTIGRTTFNAANKPVVATITPATPAKPGISPAKDFVPDKPGNFASIPNIATKPPITTRVPTNFNIAEPLRPSNIGAVDLITFSNPTVPKIKAPRTMNPGIKFLTSTLIVLRFVDMTLKAFIITLTPTLKTPTATTAILKA